VRVNRASIDDPDIIGGEPPCRALGSVLARRRPISPRWAWTSGLFRDLPDALDRLRPPRGDGPPLLLGPRGAHVERTGRLLRRYAGAGFDDAVVLLAPGGPAPEEVRALLPR